MNKPTWTAGYVSDAPYTLGFYREMGPEHMAFAAAINGYAVPTRPGLRYCELGCGRGFGTLLFAAANPDREFVGIDFNPAHIQEAQALADRAGITNVRFIEASFAEMAASEDPELTGFDMIGLHGVLTWIGPEVVADVQNILRRHLKPGGICYASYNTLPGWAQTMPMQRLIREVASRTPGDSIRGFQSAVQMLDALDKANTGYLKNNPGARSRIARFSQHSLHYLVHEYLNENWRPYYVTEVMDKMAEAKLSYVGAAGIINNRVVFNVPDTMLQMVNSAPDLAMRELLKDFIADRQFRRDIYIKGGIRAGKTELERAYENMTLTRLNAVPEGKMEFEIPVGTARPEPTALAAVMEAVSDGPARIAEIRAYCEKKGVKWNDLPGIFEILLNHNILAICRSDHDSVDRAPAARLNQVVFDLAKGDDTHSYVASPVLGSAIGAAYPERILAPLVLGETADAPVGPDQAFDWLQQHGKSVTHEGKAVTDPAAARDKLSEMLGDFRKKSLPAWRRLGIVD